MIAVHERALFDYLTLELSLEGKAVVTPRAFALSVIPRNRRRSLIAADNSPSCSKTVRIAAASASVTMNIPLQQTAGQLGQA